MWRARLTALGRCFDPAILLLARASLFLVLLTLLSVTALGLLAAMAPILAPLLGAFFEPYDACSHAPLAVRFPPFAIPGCAHDASS